MAAGVGELGNAVIDLVAGGQEQQRIVADADRHRTGLALLEIFLADDPAVLAGRHPQAQRLLVMDHHPVGADIDPIGIRVLHDHQIAGADEAPAVELMEERHRELVDIHVLVAIDVLQHGAGLDGAGRDRLEILHAVAIGADDVEGGVGLGQAEGDGEALGRIGHARKDAEALLIARNVVEQQAGRVLGRIVIDHLGDGADLEVPVGAVDVLDLAGALDAFEPVPQVGVGLVVSGVAGGALP